MILNRKERRRTKASLLMTQKQAAEKADELMDTVIAKAVDEVVALTVRGPDNCFTEDEARQIATRVATLAVLAFRELT